MGKRLIDWMAASGTGRPFLWPTSAARIGIYAGGWSGPAAAMWSQGMPWQLAPDVKSIADVRGDLRVTHQMHPTVLA